MDRDLQPIDEPGAAEALVAEACLATSAIDAGANASRVRVFRSEALFAGGVEVQIAHGEATYRLRRTSLGKLILIK